MPVHFCGWSSPLPKKGEGVVIGGPTVNTDAQNAEQANQQKAQQYAAQQQQAALAGVNGWLAQNKPPGQAAQAIARPQAASPTTMGGGRINAASGTMQAPPQAQMQQPQAPPQQRMPQAQPPMQPQTPQPGPQPQAQQMNPQQRAMLIQQMRAQMPGAM